MSLSKTEQTLLIRLCEARESKFGSVSVSDLNEVLAAQDLHDKGLVVYVDQSLWVDKDGVGKHGQPGPFTFVFQGYLEI